MRNFITAFIADEGGAISVEWVALTAGMVVLAGTSGWLVHEATKDTGQQIGTYMETVAER